MRVVELSAAEAARHRGALAGLLRDAVAGGASVGFLDAITADEAGAFWQDIIDAIASGGAHLFAALDGERLLGTVLLQPSPKPNQRHRADVAKLLVLRDARRRGVGTLLMDALEAKAQALDRSLLTLDTSGGGAETLYQRRGYTAAGEIPGYAAMPDGSLCGTTFYYKQLNGAP